MKQVFHRIMSVAMAFVVLFSTMSFTINMHYCGGVLAETAIFLKAKGCGMEMQSLYKKECSVTKKNCCSDEQLVIDGQDELQLSIDKISFAHQIFIASLVFTYVDTFEVSNKNLNPYKVYKPPLVVKPIYKIDESYLI